MPKPRRKNRRPAAKGKKKPQKPARPARSVSRSYSYSRSRSYSDSEGSSDGHSDEDDPRDYKRGGYHPVTPYQLYNARYRVLSKLGAGAFSTVWLCADEKQADGQLVAMKVCKSKKSVTEQAQDEVMLFEQMRPGGASGSPFVVMMTDHFWHTGPNGRHKCMTFEVMGENLLALVKHYNYDGLPLDLCRRLSRHTLKGLEYIHSCGVIHTDVKLENVLICRHDMTALIQEARQAHMAFSSQKTSLESLSKSQKKRLKKKNKKEAQHSATAPAELKEVSDGEKLDNDIVEAPEAVQVLHVNGKGLGGGYGPTNGETTAAAPDEAPVTEIPRPIPPVRQRERFDSLTTEQTFAKLADFGNGIKSGHVVTNDIQTRQYRSPEVIIGSAWDETADVWSAACMFFELVTGDFLFDPKMGKDWDRDEDHLALIAELLGDLPDKEYCLSGKYSKDFFNNSGKLKHIKTMKMWPLIGVLKEKYDKSAEEANEMAEFLLPMLTWEPTKRQSASEALKHAWVQLREGEMDEVDESVVKPDALRSFEDSEVKEPPSTETEAQTAPETPEEV